MIYVTCILCILSNIVLLVLRLQTHAAVNFFLFVCIISLMVSSDR
jgi:hypothetical protein